jgi:hypothetical protein
VPVKRFKHAVLLINFIILATISMSSCGYSQTKSSPVFSVCSQISQEDYFIKATSQQYLTSINDFPTPFYTLEHLVAFIGVEQGSVEITIHRLDLLAQNASPLTVKIIQNLIKGLTTYDLALQNAHTKLSLVQNGSLSKIKQTINSVATNLTISHNELSEQTYQILKSINSLPKSKLRQCLKGAANV